jgi:hypothetical protein
MPANDLTALLTLFTHCTLRSPPTHTMATQAVHFTDKSAVTSTAGQPPLGAPADDADFSRGPSAAQSAALEAHADGADLNTTAPTPADVSIPGVLFAIPFPPAAGARADAKAVAARPSFLLYAPPRAEYRKPAAGEDGKAGKEKLVKRVERGWQEEVAQGNAIKAGELPDAGKWAKTKGALTRVRAPVMRYKCMRADPAQNAAKLIQWLPNSNIEALSRIPPKKKMHEVRGRTPFALRRTR